MAATAALVTTYGRFRRCGRPVEVESATLTMWPPRGISGTINCAGQNVPRMWAAMLEYQSSAVTSSTAVSL